MLEPGGATRYKSNNELVLEEKDKIRSLLGFSPDLGDAAPLTFAEPILRAWGLDCQWLQSPGDRPKLAEHYCRCRDAKQPGVVLLAEGAP